VHMERDGWDFLHIHLSSAACLTLSHPRLFNCCFTSASGPKGKKGEEVTARTHGGRLIGMMEKRGVNFGGYLAVKCEALLKRDV